MKGKKEIKGKKIREYSKKTAKSQIKKVKGKTSHKNTEMQQKLAFITKVAKDDLAQRFTFDQLASAISGNEKEGFVVHGYLEEAYPEDWEALIYVEIFDRACYYAEQNPKISISRMTDNINLKDYIKTPTILREVYTMDNYPHQPFKRCIMLAKKQFEDSVHWVNDYPFDFDGVDVKTNHSSFNLGLFGWAMYNLPIFVVLHAPNKDEGINEARVQAEDIKEIKVDIRQKLISIQRNEIEPLKAKIFEKEHDASLWQENYHELEKEERYHTKRRNLIASTSSSASDQSSMSLSHFILIGTTVLFFITTLVGFLT